MKDEKYWIKRKKNNDSAKTSREAQRVKGAVFFQKAEIDFFYLLKTFCKLHKE